jgi:tetratricopeptide (TPR) repeat protein
MSFICQNPTCAIAISKQEFAKQLYDVLNGNCPGPGCQQPLVELKVEPLLSEDDEQLIASLPYVIAYPLKQTLLEKHASQRISYLKDTFLNYLKYLGLLTASEFFNSSINDRSMVALFHKNLMETAFGKWNDYIRNALIFLKQQNHSFFCAELPAYYELVETGNKAKKFKGEIEYQDANGDTQHIVQSSITSIGMLINFRNRYLGHGLTLDSEKSEELWALYFPIFRSLLEQMSFAQHYPMYKKEHGEAYLLQSAEIESIEIPHSTDANIWIQHASGNTLNILPFFIVPGEVAMIKEDKPQIFTYESYTGKTIKFFSPEGIEKQTSGKILDRLNLLLRDKQKEIPFTPDTFTKEIFLKRIEEENKLLLDTLISEKKIIPGVYQHRENIEIKLREWIGARANIFFIAAEAGSGKTNLLAEIQKQYTERAYPGLLIRAGRMEKNTLKEQVAYLLNIDANEGLDKYTSIAGTQAEPSFILIDGLNEAHNSEAIWQEIMDWSKVIETGSIKFVVTSRANTKADLERYKTEETDLNFLYGENKDHEKGLGAYAFWLTPLDMNEMKGAWENYVAKDKSRYKPLFSFDDIATFDRAIYNQINNPLVLRLFLEIYNGKNLPKKGGKHLHIWKDWFNTFSPEEQTFLKLLADEVWLKGENELLLDDLLNNEKLKAYLTSDLVNSPYARMKNMGWVSRYVKDLNGCLGFTVEGALLYLLGVKLQGQEPKLDLKYIQTTLSNGTKLQQSAIESFLCEQASEGDLDLVTELIDSGTEQMDLCIRPLFYYLKTYGVEALIEKVLEEPTENDWKVLVKLDKKLQDLELHVLRKEFLMELTLQNTFQIKESLWLGLKAFSIFEKELAVNYLSQIDTSVDLIKEDVDILSALGSLEFTFGNYENALEYFEKCMVILLKSFGDEHPKIAAFYSDFGSIFNAKGDYEKAIEYYQKQMNFLLKKFGDQHPEVANVYLYISTVCFAQGSYDKSLEFIQKSLDIQLRNFGIEYSGVANSYLIKGNVWMAKGDFYKALEYYEKCLKIHLKTFGEEHTIIATSYNNIGNLWNTQFDGEKALVFLQKGLDIQLKNLGEEHPIVANSYINIGNAWLNINDEQEKALVFLQKGLDIQLKSLGEEHPHLAISYEKIAFGLVMNNDNDKALEYFQKSLLIRLKTLGEEHPDTVISYANVGFLFLMNNNPVKAIEYYQKCLNFTNKIEQKGDSLFHIALCYEALENKMKAFDYFIQSAEIRKDELEFGLDNDETKESIENAIRLAKQLRKEDKLPDWIQIY